MVDGHLAHGKSRKTKKSKETPYGFKQAFLEHVVCSILYASNLKTTNELLSETHPSIHPSNQQASTVYTGQ